MHWLLENWPEHKILSPTLGKQSGKMRSVEERKCAKRRLLNVEFVELSYRIVTLFLALSCFSV